MREFGFQWHLTDQCNRRCLHCYQDSFSSDKELDFEGKKLVAKSIFETLSDRSISVNLTGGEPFLVPMLGEFVEYLRNFPNLDELYVITNGTIKGQPLLHDKLFQSDVTGLKISIESGDSKINDYIRGAGNLILLSENIGHFVSCGHRVILMMTLAKYNLSTIEKTVNFARKLSVNEVIFERFVPIGRGKELCAETLDVSDWSKAVETILKVGCIDAEPTELTQFKAFWLDISDPHNTSLKAAPCALGDESMAIMPDGTVFPCRRLPIPIGNVASEPFEKVLSSLIEYSPNQSDNLHLGCRALVSAVVD